MTQRNIISVNDKDIYIPLELFRAMGSPGLIRIIPLPDPDIAEIEKYDVKRLIEAENRIKQLLYLPFAKRRERLPKLIKLQSVSDRCATYYNNTDFNFKHFQFHIVNYHPCYFLMPISDLTEADSREKSWKEIKDYHEHLVADLQDENANRVSQWLAKDVFKKLKGKTFLELGCGAGRNLLALYHHMRDIKTTGLDINPVAIDMAKEQLKKFNSELLCKSIYKLGSFRDNSFDIVFTAGVLMHIPPEKVAGIIKEMNRIAKTAVVHFELDGPSHNFDYHRYPRNYKKLYDQTKIGRKITYRLFPPSDFRSNMSPPFAHALLISKPNNHLR